MTATVVRPSRIEAEDLVRAEVSSAIGAEAVEISLNGREGFDPLSMEIAYDFVVLWRREWGRAGPPDGKDPQEWGTHRGCVRYGRTVRVTGVEHFRFYAHLFQGCYGRTEAEARREADARYGRL